MKKIIGVLDGDYIGPEINAEALKVLDAVAQKYGHTFERVKLYASGEAYDKFGEILPEETLKKGAECDALLKGPFGGPPEEINHPKWSQVEKEAILPLRKHFNLYANLRETKVYDSLLDISPLKPEKIKGTNILIVRELVSGIYFGKKKSGVENGERVSSDTEEYTESEISRIAAKAFELALQRRKKLTLVAKSNVLVSSQLWREVVAEIQPDYPDVEFDYMHVDNASMQLILNPKQFDVILTGNMFGDILSDEASVLAGSIGLQPSASIGEGSFGLYEPIHGSAPSIAGKDMANPISSILSAALMLKHSFDMSEEAAAIERAVEEVISSGCRTVDLYSAEIPGLRKVGTKEFGDLVAAKI